MVSHLSKDRPAALLGGNCSRSGKGGKQCFSAERLACLAPTRAEAEHCERALLTRMSTGGLTRPVAGGYANSDSDHPHSLETLFQVAFG